MFTWQNGNGSKEDRLGGRWNEPFVAEPEKEGEAGLSGVLLHDDQGDLPCTFAVGASAKVSFCEV